MRLPTLLLIPLMGCVTYMPTPEVVAAAQLGEQPKRASCEEIARQYLAQHREGAVGASTTFGEIYRGWYMVIEFAPPHSFRYAWVLPATSVTESGVMTPYRFFFLGTRMVAFSIGAKATAVDTMDGGGLTASQAGIAPAPKPKPQATDDWPTP